MFSFDPPKVITRRVHSPSRLCRIRRGGGGAAARGRQSTDNKALSIPVAVRPVFASLIKH